MLYYVLIIMLISLIFLLKPQREGMRGDIIPRTRETFRSYVRRARRTGNHYLSQGHSIIRRAKKTVGI